MRLLRRTRPSLSPTDRERLELAKRDQVLALLELPGLQARLVMTADHLVLLPDAGTVVRRPWHLVDGAGWRQDEDLLSITWVDGEPAWRFAVPEPDPRALQALRERVQASVVTHEDASLGGQRGSVRVVVRQDLSSGELLLQTLYSQGARPGDPRVAARVQAVAAGLRDAVGLPAE